MPEIITIVFLILLWLSRYSKCQNLSQYSSWYFYGYRDKCQNLSQYFSWYSNDYREKCQKLDAFIIVLYFYWFYLFISYLLLSNGRITLFIVT